MMGCQSINMPFMSYDRYQSFTFHDDQNQTFTLASYAKKYKKRYFLLVESHGGESALEEKPCGKIVKISFPEEAKYCFQMETAMSVLSPHNQFIIIEALEYPSKFGLSTYQTSEKTAKALRENYKGFRATLMNVDGTILTQRHNVIWPNELKTLTQEVN